MLGKSTLNSLKHIIITVIDPWDLANMPCKKTGHFLLVHLIICKDVASVCGNGELASDGICEGNSCGIYITPCLWCSNFIKQKTLTDFSAKHDLGTWRTQYPTLEWQVGAQMVQRRRRSIYIALQKKGLGWLHRGDRVWNDDMMGFIHKHATNSLHVWLIEAWHASFMHRNNDQLGFEQIDGAISPHLPLLMG